jgi:hypothetical protein
MIPDLLESCEQHKIRRFNLFHTLKLPVSYCLSFSLDLLLLSPQNNFVPEFSLPYIADSA